MSIAPAIAALMIGMNGLTGGMNTFRNKTNNGIATAARIDPSET